MTRGVCKAGACRMDVQECAKHEQSDNNEERKDSSVEQTAALYFCDDDEDEPTPTADDDDADGDLDDAGNENQYGSSTA